MKVAVHTQPRARNYYGRGRNPTGGRRLGGGTIAVPPDRAAVDRSGRGGPVASFWSAAGRAAAGHTRFARSARW